VQHPPSHSPLLHLEPLPEAGISSAIWEHQDQGMIHDFVQAFAPEPAQVCVAIMAIPKPNSLSIDYVAFAMCVNRKIEYACCMCLPLMS